MKTKITALALVAVTALSLTPKPALADDKTLALLGGFLGGVILGSELSHDRVYVPSGPAVVVNDRGYGRCAPTVIVDDRDDDSIRRYDDCAPAGYWRNVTVRVWVDARWLFDGYDYCGRPVRRYVGGHYEFRTDRVWVSLDRHDRRDREVGYGYGHRR